MNYLKQLLFFVLLSVCVNVSIAQTLEGKVQYTRSQSWLKMLQKMDYISEDERARLEFSYRKDEGYTTKMDLLFSEKNSLYTYSDESENSRGYSWVDRKYVIYRDFENQKRIDQIETLGKVYIIEDSINTPKWKILNEIKEVSGYLCMKAQTYDILKNQHIVAWFAQDIPVQAGPALYSGLPGLILEININDGEVEIIASKVEIKPIATQITLPKKLKGKKITQAEYHKMTDEHIKSSIKERRNPYWSIDY